MFLDAKCEAAMPQARQTFEKRLRPSTSSSVLIEYGRFPEWPKGTDCKSAGFAFGGSNPPSPTKQERHLHGVFFVWWNEAFPYGNIKQPSATKTLSLMKCACGTIRNALLHKFAKRICIMVAKPPLHICEANASLSFLQSRNITKI